MKKNELEVIAPIDSVVAKYSEDNSYAIANVEEWYDKNIENWRESPNKTHLIYVPTNLMWLRLCLGVKDGDISRLALDVDNIISECVSPVGKIISSKLPDGYERLEAYQDILYKLL
nr:hypothetical protein [Vibrio splendidus]MCC4880862.1 hypothetical protein [Vibrio splendidus]